MQSKYQHHKTCHCNITTVLPLCKKQEYVKHIGVTCQQVSYYSMFSNLKWIIRDKVKRKKGKGISVTDHGGQ
jgi:predicted transcriptional regulator